MPTLPVEKMRVVVAQSALEDASWSAADRRKLAKALKRRQLFGYARKL